jgi:hypothetical protein
MHVNQAELWFERWRDYRTSLFICQDICKVYCKQIEVYAILNYRIYLIYYVSMTERSQRQPKLSAEWVFRKPDRASVEALREPVPHVALRQHLWNQAVLHIGTPRGDLYHDSWGFFTRADKSPKLLRQLSSLVIDDILHDPKPDFDVVERALPALHPIQEFEVLARIATTPQLQEAVSKDRWAKWWVRANLETPPLSEYNGGDTELDLRMLARNNAELAIGLYDASSQLEKELCVKNARDTVTQINEIGIRSGLVSYRTNGEGEKAKLHGPEDNIVYTHERHRLEEQFDHLLGKAGFFSDVSDPELRSIYKASTDGLPDPYYQFLRDETVSWETAPRDRKMEMADAMILLLAADDTSTTQALIRSPFTLSPKPEIEQALRNVVATDVQDAIGLEQHEYYELDYFEQMRKVSPEKALRTLYMFYEKASMNVVDMAHLTPKALSIGLYLARYAPYIPDKKEASVADKKTDGFISLFNTKREELGNTVVFSPLIQDGTAFQIGLRNLRIYLQHCEAEVGIRNLLKVLESLNQLHTTSGQDHDMRPYAFMGELVSDIDIRWDSLCARASKTQVVQELTPHIERLLPIALEYTRGFNKRWGYSVPEPH